MIQINRKTISTFFTQSTLIFVIFIETVIFLRLILKLLGASEQSLFVRWFYQASFKLIYPFWDSFPLTSINGKYPVEISSIFAMFIYAIMAFLIIYFSLSLAGPKKTATQRYV